MAGLVTASGYVRDRVTWLGYASLAYLLFLESSLGPAMPALRDDLNMSYTVAGFHFTALAAGMVIASWLGDRVARRLGRGRSFWLGALGITLGAALLVVSPVAAGTIAGASMIGVCGALLSIVVQASLADRHREFRSTALAEVNLAGTSGAILATVVVGLSERTELGWRGAVIMAIAVGIGVAALLRSAEFPQGIPPAAGRRAPRHALPGLFWVCCVVGTLSAGIEWGVIFWGADFLNQELDMSKSAAAISMSGFFVAMAIGRFSGSRISRRFNHYDLLLWTFLIVAVGIPFFWLSGQVAMTVVGLFLIGLGVANVYPLVASIAIGLAPGDSDVAIARMLFTGSLAVLAAPFALGVLGDLFGIKAAFGIVVPLTVAAISVVLGMRRAHGSTGVGA
jgi:MFS family permease